MRRVLQEAMERRSPLWRKLIRRPRRSAHGNGTSHSCVGRGSGGGGSNPTQLATMGRFQTFSYFDRNFNVVNNERLRWQDGGFKPFYKKWCRFIGPHHPNSIKPLLELRRLDGRSDQFIDVGTGLDVTETVHEELQKVVSKLHEHERTGAYMYITRILVLA